MLHQSTEMAPHVPATNYISSETFTLHCQLCSTRYTALRIKNCSKSTSAIKVATMKNTNDFGYKWKPSSVTTNSTPFALPFSVSKDKWDTKENTGKSMKNAYIHTVLWYAKRHLSGQSNIKQ